MSRENSKNKIQVLERIYVDFYSAETLASLLKTIQDAIDKYGEDANISRDYEGDFFISYHREETDSEYNARQARLKKQRERSEKAIKAKKEKLLAELATREAEERELFETLKKKYGA